MGKHLEAVDAALAEVDAVRIARAAKIIGVSNDLLHAQASLLPVVQVEVDGRTHRGIRNESVEFLRLALADAKRH